MQRKREKLLREESSRIRERSDRKEQAQKTSYRRIVESMRSNSRQLMLRLHDKAEEHRRRKQQQQELTSKIILERSHNQQHLSSTASEFRRLQEMPLPRLKRMLEKYTSPP